MKHTKYTPALVPKEHQAVAIEQMLSKNIPNFDDQGLGKCKQAYDVGSHMLAAGEIELVLMVVKGSLRENTLRELQSDACQVEAKIVSGSKIQRLALYSTLPCHFLIISFDMAVTDQAELMQVMKHNRTLLCVDESHYVKNIKSQRTQACLLLGEQAVKTLVFSGTPAPNRMKDLYPQLKMCGLDVGRNEREFKNKFKTPESLRNFLQENFIRRRKEALPELGIPSKNVYKVNVTLSGEQEAMYERAATELIIDLRTKAGQHKSIPINGLLAQLTRLTQIASNPRLVSPGYDGVPAKFVAADKIVHEAIRNGDKLILWTSYRENLTELMERYKKYRPLALFGDVTREQRAENCRLFKESPEHSLIIAIPACAREGFTLTTASKAVYFDRNFSYLDWAQSQDRIHRISQTKDCKIYVLEAEGTVDCRIDAILQRKNQLQAFLLGEADTVKPVSTVTISEALDLLKN